MSNTYRSKRNSNKWVTVVNETKDYSLYKLTHWVHYTLKNGTKMKMEYHAFHAAFAKVSF